MHALRVRYVTRIHGEEGHYSRYAQTVRHHAFVSDSRGETVGQGVSGSPAAASLCGVLTPAAAAYDTSCEIGFR